MRGVPTLGTGEYHDRQGRFCRVGVGDFCVDCRNRFRIQRMNSADHRIVSTDIHLDSACRAGRRAKAAARTRIRINYRSTLNPANAGQFVINSGGTEGTKPDTVKAGDTDRCLDDGDRSFDRLCGLRGRQIKNDLSRVSARDTDREVFRSLAFTKRGIPVVDLTREVARTAGAAAAIGAVKRTS